MASVSRKWQKLWYSCPKPPSWAATLSQACLCAGMSHRCSARTQLIRGLLCHTHHACSALLGKNKTHSDAALVCSEREGSGIAASSQQYLLGLFLCFVVSLKTEDIEWRLRRRSPML